jgi:hypothetical protein
MAIYKLKIYLDKSIFKWYFEFRNNDRFKIFVFFRGIINNIFEPYTSYTVIQELINEPKDVREKILDLIPQYNINIIPKKNADVLAQLYIENSIIPANHICDALHIAISAVNKLDILVSVNNKHIVCDKTRFQTSVINKLNGCNDIKIFSPEEAIIYEEEMRSSYG